MNYTFLIAPLFFIGCCKTVYVDRVVEVKVPVKCKMKEVSPAKANAKDGVMLIDIIRERDELRESVKSCQ